MKTKITIVLILGMLLAREANAWGEIYGTPEYQDMMQRNYQQQQYQRQQQETERQQRQQLELERQQLEELRRLNQSRNQGGYGIFGSQYSNW